MPTEKLTALAVESAKPKDKPYKLSDGGGLVLLVPPTGSKLWQYRYRHEGKERVASFGRYPQVSLSTARALHKKARAMVELGTDPVAHNRSEREARAERKRHTFEAVAEEWWERWRTDKTPRHADYFRRRLEQNVYPKIGTMPITDIEARHLIKMAESVQSRGALDLGVRVLQMTGQVFKYAVGKGYVRYNPVREISSGEVLQSVKTVNCARVDSKELPELLRRIEAYQGTPITRLAIKLMSLTFVRTGELIGARWSEIDLDAGRWDIPAERMKMRTPLVVPLSRQAIAVLKVLHLVTGHRDLLFPGERNHEKPMSNNTILKALERMGYKHRMTGHGFRGVASTILHEHGFDHQHIELQLSHSPRDAVSAAYNHATYLAQRATMMQWWADHLDGLRDGNVVPLRKLAG